MGAMTRMASKARGILITAVGLIVLLFSVPAKAQVTVTLAPALHPQFTDSSGNVLSGGFLYSYAAGTTTLQATYADSLGTIANANPIPLDASGSPSNSSGAQVQIWLANQSYKFCAVNSALVQQWCWDNVSSYQVLTGLTTLTSALTAPQFNGPATGWTTPLTIATATNKPTVTTTNPAASGQNYVVPDPGTPTTHFLLDTGSTNTLDCTAGIITCKRTAQYYFSGGSCNNATASLGWDSFGANAPVPNCVTGTNVQKGVMGLPSAYTHLQANTGTSSAAGTVTTTYPAAITAGDLLILSVAFNSTTTITGCTDGTNAYTQAKHVASGALSLDIWVFHNAATKPAGTTLTCTFSVAASSSLKWHEYLVPNVTSTDVTASNTGTGTAVTTSATAGTTQNTELIFAAAGDLAAPTLVAATANYTDHAVLNNAAVVQVDDAGLIQQAVATQNASFTLGTSQAWAAAIVTIKAANASPVIAQRTVTLPTFLNASAAVNASIKWVSPANPLASAGAVLGAALGCVADGATDDPVFNADTTATAAVNTTAPNLPITTALNGLGMTGCAAGNTAHFQLKRLRYNAGDTYEGFVNVMGASLLVGITQ